MLIVAALVAANLTYTAPPAWKSRPASSSMRVAEWVVPRAQGDADEVVPAQAVLDWAAKQPHKPRLHVFAGAGHFFHGRLHELKPLVLDFLRS